MKSRKVTGWLLILLAVLAIGSAVVKECGAGGAIGILLVAVWLSPMVFFGFKMIK